MKMNIGQIFSGVRLLIRLCWPATVFIGLCTGIFIAFGVFLRTFFSSSTNPSIVGGSWLLLLIFYIILGVAFIRLNARRVRGSFGSEELRVQRRMAALSGLPFYVVCLFFFMASILCAFYPDVNAVTAFVSVVGFFGFILVSLSYLLLMRFFLGRSAAIAYQ